METERKTAMFHRGRHKMGVKEIFFPPLNQPCLTKFVIINSYICVHVFKNSNDVHYHLQLMKTYSWPFFSIQQQL